MKKPSFVLVVSTLALAVTAAFAEDQTAHYAQITQAAKEANKTTEPVADGPFKPDWDSLKQYQEPDWFRDAKFGIWAHWGPQCAPEHGDWYARNMYQQYRTAKDGTKTPNEAYAFHVAHYGHPSKFGFKDVINTWHAENWDPDKLLELYKRAGAKYFVALANHHDNFDTWDSKYQEWNAVNIGPKKDLIGGWAVAARKAGLRFGVSVHAARAWGWQDKSRDADVDGPLKGVPYDGEVTAADGKGLWWDGLDPQDLYAQNHSPKAKPDADYCNKFYNRTIDLVNKYHPDLLYFDDDISGGLPLYNVDPTVGLRIAAHYYNANLKEHDGKEEAVIAAKKLTLERRKVLTFDIERGGAQETLPEPWETDTCIGQWHYSRGIFEHHGYKKSPDVIRTLIDIVSKNGNLLLSIPVRSDGTIDDDEVKFLNEMAAWMDVNSEAIFGTRPWEIYGEGPSAQTATPGAPARDNAVAFTPQDFRFTQKDGALYAFAMAWPGDGKLTIASLGSGSPHLKGEIKSVQLLGDKDPVAYTRDATGVHLTVPAQPPCPAACVFKIETRLDK